MTPHMPDDIRTIVQALQLHHMEVTGPVSTGDHVLYHVNGHALTEDELRKLATNSPLTSWDILNYTKMRSGRRAG
jgi:hypothetical protein